jgi:hypothetical protein
VRILITQRELIHWGGSQMVTIEVAKELRNRGHEVAVFCPHPGEAAKIIFPAGVWVKSRLSEIPWEPDIIHGHHHLQTIAALSYFVKVPAIYYCHGVRPWVEQVPLHPRIRHYVMMCEWMVSPNEMEFGVPRSRMTVISNFVNMNRFSEVRKPPDKLRRALLFGNKGFGESELLRLERACSEQGISLDKVGYPYGNPKERPEAFLPDYDLVFAIGRCAVEAIACGCAVIPVVPGQAGQLVTTENFADWVFSNFSPVYGTCATQIDGNWLRAELKKYSPADTSEVSARLRKENDLNSAISKIESIYQTAIEDYKNNKEPSATEFAPYLERMSLEVDAMWQRETSTKRREAQQEERIARLEQQLRSIRSSTTWLLTKPVRVVGSILRRRRTKTINIQSSQDHPTD